MPDPTSSESQYTMGYSEEFQRFLDRRNAENHATHLMPHLKPGLRILDFGCGPGSISVGLARTVEPGEFHGIDLEESQIQIARAGAEAGGHTNATFRVADVTDLPFEDDFFDVAHCHAVLMHVPDTQAALAEVMRVLRPGGVIAAREMMTAASFTAPENEDLRAMWSTFGNLLAANGGHPESGKELKGALLEAGFANITTSASFDMFDSPGDVAFFHAFVNQWFFSPEVIEPATKYGLVTREQFDGWRLVLDEWSQLPAASAAMAFGEAIAYKP